jgi:phage-related protein
MSTFPTLKTGAVMQYPAKKQGTYSTQVVRFLDGSEQRFRDYVQPVHSWIVKLDQLDESEMNSLREFFRILDGGSEGFSFTDPWDDAVYPDCSLGDEMLEAFAGEQDGTSQLVITENRS